MGVPTNPVHNQFYILTIKQPEAGGVGMAWNAVYNFAAIGGTPELTAAGGKADKLLFVYEDGTMKCLGAAQGI